MAEIHHIPDIEPERPSLAAQLQSLLGEALGCSEDPERATAMMLEALQMRAELPGAQRRIAELEAALVAERAKLPPLEAEARRGRNFLAAIASEHKRAQGPVDSDNPDMLIGFALAAISSHVHTLPMMIERVEAQAKELAEVKAKYAEFDPVMVMFAEALGKVDSAEIARVAGEALEARSEREASRIRMQEIERAEALRKLDVIIARGISECRLTLVSESNLRQGFANGVLTLEAIDLMVGSMPRIPAFEKKEPPAPRGVAMPDLTWNDKTYAELKGKERVALKQENPALFEQMRRAAGMVP